MNENGSVDWFERLKEHITFRYFHASGPGGQNVNKVETGVELLLNLEMAALTKAQKEQLNYAHSHSIANQYLSVKSSKHRSQLTNKLDAIHKLNRYLEEATMVRQERKATRPSYASKMKRIETKKRRAVVKSTRSKIRHNYSEDN